MPDEGFALAGLTGLSGVSVVSNCSLPRRIVKVAGFSEPFVSVSSAYISCSGAYTFSPLKATTSSFSRNFARAAGLLVATFPMMAGSAGEIRILRRDFRSYHLVGNLVGVG